MSEWKPKRFWKQATAVAAEHGFAVELDGRPVKTPAKRALVMPTQAMAEAVAAEWDAQVEEVDPGTMPMTRAANAAIDKVTQQKTEVADLLAAYGDSDLLCYRADGPASLIQRQAEAWDPLLDWAAEVLEARLLPVAGVMHQAQSPKALQNLSDRVHAMGPFQLTAFHDLVGLSGSLILGFAAVHDYADAASLWQVSRVDELWQAEQWGADEEAQETAILKESEFLSAKRFNDLAQIRG